MSAQNCPRVAGDCAGCPMFGGLDESDEIICYQDDDAGGTGHGDISYSDADPGL